MPCEHCDPTEHDAFDIELRELLKKHLRTGIENAGDDTTPEEGRELLTNVATRLAFHLGTVGRMLVAVERRHGDVHPDVALDGPETLVEAFAWGIDHAEHHDFTAEG